MKREIDALLNEPAEREAFSRLFKLIRNSGSKLFRDGNSQRSLKPTLSMHLGTIKFTKTGSLHISMNGTATTFRNL